MHNFLLNLLDYMIVSHIPYILPILYLIWRKIILYDIQKKKFILWIWHLSYNQNNYWITEIAIVLASTQ